MHAAVHAGKERRRELKAAAEFECQDVMHAERSRHDAAGAKPLIVDGPSSGAKLGGHAHEGHQDAKILKSLHARPYGMVLDEGTLLSAFGVGRSDVVRAAFMALP